MNVKALQKQLMAAIAMVLVAAIALCSATYAWFVNNTMVKSTEVTLAATSAYALLISDGAVGSTSGWVTTHTMSQTGSKNVTLEPVSTTGKNQTTPMTFAKQSEWKINTANSNKSEVNKYTTTTANTEYLKESFEIKASQACDLYLDQETVFQIADATNGSGSTLGKTLRLALVVTDSNGENAQYFFYTINDEKTSGAANTTLNGTAGADGLKTAIKDGTKEGAEAVGAISADNLSSDAVKKLVTVTGATNTALVTSTGSADKLYSFSKAEEVCKVTAYIWIEGCDEDTVAANISTLTGADNGFKATLGFCAAQQSNT